MLALYLTLSVMFTDRPCPDMASVKLPIHITSKGTKVKDLVQVASTAGKAETIQCGNYWVYYVGTGTPKPAMLQFTRVLEKSALPLKIRLKDTDNTEQYYQAWISETDCEVQFDLEADDGDFFIEPTNGTMAPAPTQTPRGNGDCLTGCSPCDTHSRYRVTYDMSTHQVCMMERDASGNWRRPKKNKFIPRIGQYMDVKYVNLNAIRDSVSLEYQYENMNLENSEEFLAAMLATTSQTGVPSTPAKETALETEQDSIVEDVEKGIASDDNEGLIEALDAIVMLQATLKGWAENASMEKPAITLKAIDKGTEAERSSLLELDLHTQDVDKQVADIFHSCDSLLKLKGDKILVTEGKTITKSELTSKLEKARKAIPVIEKDYRKLRARADLATLRKIGELFKAELRVAEAAVLTPDRMVLKVKLDSILNAELPERAGVPQGMAERLNTIIGEGTTTGLLNEAQTKDFTKLKEDVLKDYRNMVTYKVFALAPIQVQDYDVIKLQFKTNGKALNDAPYEIPTRGGWKLDFSTGAILTGLRDRSYYYDDVRSSVLVTQGSDGSDSLITKSYGTIRESTKNKLGLNFGAMMHAYSRTGKYWNAGPSIGFVVGTTGLRVLGGGSILLGKRQRLVLSVGLAAGYIDKLQDGRKTEVEKELSATDQSGSVPVQRDIDTSWFAGASWNFGGARLTR